MSPRRASLLVFLVAAGLLFVLHGNRFVLTNDEGILLEPARSILHGSRPYVDFFGYMSPGSYWLQAAWFRLLGVSYAVGRVPVILDLALECALLFWLVARLASRNAAVAATVLFFGFQISDAAFLTAQHRWDSGALALAGVCLALTCENISHIKLRAAASGALCAAAAWCTPSAIYVLLVAAAWFAWPRERRPGAKFFIAGVGAVTASAVLFLAAQGTLIPLIKQLQWLQRNYAAMNVMPYGAVPGGYAKLFEGSAGFELVVRAFVVACLALPAILPIAAVLIWPVAAASKKMPAGARDSMKLLVPAMLALTATIFPRADMMHLAFVAALPYAITAILLAQLLPRRIGAGLFFVLFPFAALFAANDAEGWWNTQIVESPAGHLRVESRLAPEMRALFATVHPGQTMFVYPYMPVEYFVTQTRNVSRYPYLQAGLMTRQDAATALEELRAHPPQWLLYMPLTQEEFLRVFPHAKSLDWRFATLESWLDQNYAPASQPPLAIGGYRLMKWKDASAEQEAPALPTR